MHVRLPDIPQPDTVGKPADEILDRTPPKPDLEDAPPPAESDDKAAIAAASYDDNDDDDEGYPVFAPPK
eukprot:gene9545-11309_t